MVLQKFVVLTTHNFLHEKDIYVAIKGRLVRSKGLPSKFSSTILPIPPYKKQRCSETETAGSVQMKI